MWKQGLKAEGLNVAIHIGSDKHVLLRLNNSLREVKSLAVATPRKAWHRGDRDQRQGPFSSVR